MILVVRTLDTNQLIVEIADKQSRQIETSRLIDAVQKILTDHKFQFGEVSIAVVDDPEIRELNKQYLEHDYETDVISFVLDCDEESGLMNAQLIVSAETADRVAKEMKHEFMRELLLYVIHGTLHLVGHDDHQEPDIQEMRDAESHYLNLLCSNQIPISDSGASE